MKIKPVGPFLIPLTAIPLTLPSFGRNGVSPSKTISATDLARLFHLD